jgi:hypothetical protein
MFEVAINGGSLVLATHDPEVAARCDRILDLSGVASDLAPAVQAPAAQAPAAQAAVVQAAVVQAPAVQAAVAEPPGGLPAMRRLLDLHQPMDPGAATGDPSSPVSRCRSCESDWPCPTFRALAEITESGPRQP